ncbi:ribosome small subunit-dependent GTPase A [Moraxella sp. RCAD0137]|uniref:ribosome small subunit-dependent GTPase A n=1 Tax=Moraxella sp. RCAD0137 TaxID=1775913 RepID=UPI000C9EEFA4|nr:ribosome small subunit-dependent GTPase A [Moraxella sp. RCAD0137]PNP98042.1 ribosome small subunit-dependent GTPase [Moraxella sp. RCAD0137]
MSLIRKRKLTKRQTRQIEQNQTTQIDDGTLATGVIISHFGKQLDVQITALPAILPDYNDQDTDKSAVALGAIWRCHTRTNLPMLATGDTVKFSLDATANLGRIEQLLDRKTLITRPDRYHKVKPVAANVDVLAIVFAPLPKPAVNLIDRYLLIARLNDITPLLVLNKSDLLPKHPEVVKIIQEYQALGDQYGFSVISTSSIAKDGLDILHQHIDGKLSIFAGQSGVGKSSLINELLPDAHQATNIISVNSQLGQHTTTTSRLLAYDDQNLSAGGIIDTPGIREYGIWHLSADDILTGFDELDELSGTCQFRDCNHQSNAKGCALWAAATQGEVLPRRIESLTSLIDEAKNGQSAVKPQGK